MQKVSGTITKKDFVKILKKQLLRLADIDVSLENGYKIFKICTLLPYWLANKKDVKVTLGGIGVFRTYKTNHTGTEIAKYYCSENISRIPPTSSMPAAPRLPTG